MYKFSQGANNVLMMADRISNSVNCNYKGTEHILAGILSSDCVARKILLACGVNSDKYFEIFKETIDLNYSVNGYTPRAKNMFETANTYALATNGGYIATEHLLLAIMTDPESTAVKILEKMGVPLDLIIKGIENELNIKVEFRYSDSFGSFNPNKIINQMAKDFFKDFEELEFEPKRNVDTSNFFGAYNPQPLDKGKQGAVMQGQEEGMFKFGTDLTALAKEGKLDPVIGREKEIERIIQILSRRTKNNPVLVGEAGVGKTAVIEGLAEKIVKGQVPELLKDKIVFSLDISGMLAGTKYRGDFEERLKDFLNDVKKSGNVIIFIDEIHNIVGAGASSESKMDAAEILKPLLARGELQTIGATTLDEYRKYIEKDPALERRFQPVQVDQPNVKDTIEILKGLRDKYEAHHKVTITDDAIEAAAELSDRYISDRFLPDKAIDLIDEACSRARLDNYTAPPDFKKLNDNLERLENDKRNAIRKNDFNQAGKIQDEIMKTREEVDKLKEEWDSKRTKSNASIGSEEVANIVALWTGVPVKKLTQTEAEKLVNLESVLHNRVIGQDEAVIAVSKAIRRARAGLKDPKRPIGSFIFVGPTGVGKTELSKALAEAVFGDENLMIRVDMSEYMEKHSVSKLVGAPPGYVGFEESGQLTEKVRRKPYSVILFDEIEKAHPDVFNILLQILDDGRLTDSKGRVVDFKNTIIIMTSNVGATEISKITSLGFGTNEKTNEYREEQTKEKIFNALKSNFKPEFLNRVDDIIVFKHLTEKETAEIAELMLNSLAKRLKEKDIEIVVTSEAKKKLVGEGFDTEYGARPLKRAIQRMVEDRLSEEILKGNLTFGDKVNIDCQGGDLLFKKI